MSDLKLKDVAKETILKDAISTYPHECCGFMYGTEDGDRYITTVEEVNNTREENRERRFEISARDYLKAEEYADENNLTLLGVYHSHPDHPAIPSEYDLRHALPYFSYIIVSIKRGKFVNLLSWRLNSEGKFEEEQVKDVYTKESIDQYIDNL